VGRRLLRFGVLGYLAALLFVPVGMIAYRTFEHGLAPVWTALTSPAATHAALLSIEITAICVPINVLFGIAAGWLIARGRMPARRVVDAIIALPFALSPVAIGLALYVLYGRTSTLGAWLSDHGIQVLFSPLGMIVATLIITLPFAVRETVPVLEEIGPDQEQAAATLGAGALESFLRVTLPAIRWAIVYGVVLTAARALGEFGAVAIVSGNIVGRTQTLPLFVEERFRTFDTTAAYSAGFLLALISLFVLAAMSVLTRRRVTQEAS
jgi:sulfate/thiosulfate transport system permease protein